MSHEITEIDVQQGIKQAWHGLTDVRPDLTLEESFLMQWDVIAHPVKVNGHNTGQMMFQSFERNPRTGLYDVPTLRNGKPVFIGGSWSPNSYTPLSNEKFVALISDAIRGAGHKVASVGSVMGRARIFVSIELTGLKTFTVGKRVFENYLNALSSHDMSCHLTWITSNICTVCNNTFQMNLGAATSKNKTATVNTRIKHSANMQEKLDNLPALLDEAIGVQRQFRETFASLNNKPVTPAKAERVFVGFVGSDKLSSRAEGIKDQLMKLYNTGKGNDGKTRADMFSAVTDYYTHESSGGENRLKQFVSSEFGKASEAKQRFLPIVSSDLEFDKMEERGARLVEARVKDQAKTFPAIATN